jgi:hypothetical protein
VAVGPQLGPATPEAEAFAARSRATVEGFAAQALAAERARAEIEAYEENARRAGNTSTALSPKLRSAANGLTALAFAATASNGSFQSMALGAGLAGTSLAQSFGSEKLAAMASGIGAAVVVGIALIGILDRITDSAAKADTAVDSALKSIQGIKSVSEAIAQQEVHTRKLAEAEAALAEAKRQALAGGSADAIGIGAEIARLVTLQKVVDQEREIVDAAKKKQAEREIVDVNEAQAARLGIMTQGTAAENRAWEAGAKARLATDAVSFALGRTSLDNFFAARLSVIQQSGAREVAALRQRQALLAEPVADASPAQAAERAAEIKRIGSEIAAVEARTREEKTQTAEQERQQREALDKTILGFTLKEQELSGDTSRARIAQAWVEAAEIQRALKQSRVSPDDAERRARAVATAQTIRIDFEEQQRRAQRILDTLEATKARIAAEGEAAGASQLTTQRRIADAERAQVPALQAVVAEMQTISAAARDAGFTKLADDLQLFINRAGASITGLGVIANAVRQQWNAAKDQLLSDSSVLGKEIVAALQREADASGGVTIALAFKADAIAGMKAQIDQQIASLATDAASVWVDALTAGFEASLGKGGNADKGWKAFSHNLLQGLGSLYVDLGKQLIAFGIIMTALLPALNNPLTAGPTLLLAGALLVTLGTVLGAIASRNDPGSPSTGGFSVRQRSPQTTNTRTEVVLDPDRGLRGSASTGTRTVTAPASPTPQAVGTPVIFQLGLWNPADPATQRLVKTTHDNAVRRDVGVRRR